jgi:hypothetical protein
MERGVETSAVRDFKPAFPNHMSYLGGSTKEEPNTYGSTAAELPTPANSNSPKPSKFRRPNPHRRYSTKWWGHAWDRAVEMGRWPRIIYFTIGVIIVVIWTVVM